MFKLVICDVVSVDSLGAVGLATNTRVDRAYFQEKSLDGLPVVSELTEVFQS